MSDREQRMHQALKQITDLASEIGRTPTRDEYVIRYGWSFEKALGSWTALVQGAGLEPFKAKKIDNSIFQVSIDKHLNSYKPREVVDRGPFPTAAIISDIHWPFSSPRVLRSYLEYVGDEKPEWAIINGDAWDQYSHMKYPRSHNIFTPREERDLSLKQNTDFWVEVQRRSPASRCIQMMGNHDIRPMKKILEAYPAAEDWIKEALTKDFTFPKVQTIFDPREELFIAPDIIVFHGHMSQLGAHRDYTLLSCINGHTHRGGVVWRRIRGASLFELNSGVAGDPEAKGLTYTPQKITVWTPGFGILNKRGPQFISV